MKKSLNKFILLGLAALAIFGLAGCDTIGYSQTYTTLPTVALSTAAPTISPQLLVGLLTNNIVHVGVPFTFNNQTYLITTNADGTYTFNTSGPAGNATFTPPSTVSGTIGTWQTWWANNNPTNLSFYSTNEMVAHLGAIYDNRNGEAAINIAVKKYGLIGSQPNLGLGGGIVQGNTGTQSGLAAAYGEADLRKPIGDVAVEGGVVGGYDLWNKSALAGVKGGLTYRLNPRLELWSDLVLDYEFTGTHNGFDVMAAGGLGYVF